VLALFTITVFISAVLLFAVQPMFAKMVLPLLGGTPAVWNTCMVFFQATLLAGYAYAHVTARVFGVRHQATIHLVLLVTPLLLLPIAVPAAWRSPSQDHPALWLLALLIVALGLPFFVVSTTGPLVQTWFARSNHPLAHDPYFLYAASNTGSLAALLAYPTVVEPNLHLADQSRLWSIGYVVLALLLVGCAAVVWHSRTSASPQVVPGTRGAGGSRAMLDPAASISVGKRGRWILLAFIPSSLTLGLTTYLTTDVAPMPLLWVVPLAIYLFSFVLTFGRRVRVSYSLVSRLMPIFVVPLLATMAVGSVGGLWVLVPVHLVTLFVVSLLCHGELASSRPTADHLTEFYLWIGVGGVLGGIFNALVAPAIFNGVVEYPLALVMACLVRRPDSSGTPAFPRQDVRLAVVVVAAIFGLLWLAHTLPFLRSLPAVLAVGVPALLCFAVRNRPLPFGLGMGALVMAALVILAGGDEIVFRERSFFGVSQVRVYPTERLTLLLSGTTNHGAQSLDPARRQEPLSYFHRTGPIGQVFAALDTPRVAIIGLGAGSLACYGTPGQQFTFYEIDPTVVRIARDPRYFTFLQLCPPDIRVVPGDGRLSLGAAPDSSYGLIVLDAFSSDAIPSHLLTREALRLYLRKLEGSGLLAFHISNNRLDLEPTVANLAHDGQLVALAQFDERVSPDEARAGKTPSHWVVLARRWEDLRALPHNQQWHALSARPDKTLWTDDFSNIFEVIKWR
jgi:spermidine synthase